VIVTQYLTTLVASMHSVLLD